MLTVYKFAPAWGLPDISPFVVKLETWLRLAGVPYETKPGDPRKAPKKKMPYIVDDAVTMGDTRFIIEHLTAKHGVQLDARLTPAQRAIATAFQSMLEEHLYWVVVYERWQLDENWARYTPTMRSIIHGAGVPGLLVGAITSQARKGMVTQLFNQGTGRHTRAEIARVGEELVEAAAQQLGDGPYFFGAEPATIDASMYAFTTILLDAPFEGPVRTAGQKHANLRAYVDRMRAKYWAT
jgi:glutathione S-transferase